MKKQSLGERYKSQLNDEDEDKDFKLVLDKIEEKAEFLVSIQTP